MCYLSTRILIIIAACALLYYGYTGYRNGQVYVKGHRLISREDHPQIYWASVWIYFIVGTGGILAALFLNF